jgi:UDP-N-acetyl-D-mannosaminuronic acid dehydrogenase
MDHDSEYDVFVVGGCGHVGLPLGIVLADAGLQVALYDLDVSKRDTVRAGVMPFVEYDADSILTRVIGKTLHVVDHLAAVAQARDIIVTIGTPVDEYLNPRIKPILRLGQDLRPHLRSDHCLILRSTVFPGASRAFYHSLKRQGNDVHLSYCPERIVQGYAIRELPKLPQIISGLSEAAVRRAETLFGRLGVKTLRVSVEEAEFAKLFSNAWRYIQFAITNQFYMIATECGADYANVHKAMTYEYDRAQDFPRPGFAAGPCLLKDTLQLAAFYRNQFQLGHSAMMINEGLPNFIVSHLITRLGIDLNNRRVGILGMAFKAEIDDIRDSLSYKLAKVLAFHGAEVVCSDEFVRDSSFVTKEELVSSCSVIIVGVPHSAYGRLQTPEGATLVDLWGVLPRGGETSAGDATRL